jgi:hypothetical protein
MQRQLEKARREAVAERATHEQKLKQLNTELAAVKAAADTSHAHLLDTAKSQATQIEKLRIQVCAYIRLDTAPVLKL